MKFATATSKGFARCKAVESPYLVGAARRPYRGHAAFTLAEVLAALLFMAIVIPVAVQALHIASLSGEVAVGKAQAVRIADRVLNESMVTTNWSQSANGTVTEDGREFHWTLRNESWPADSAMQLVTADVTFSVQGRNHAVHLCTLADLQSAGTTTGMLR